MFEVLNTDNCFGEFEQSMSNFSKGWITENTGNRWYPNENLIIQKVDFVFYWQYNWIEW